MTDVTVAPQGSAPPAAPNEAVINENPTSSPNPIGSQAPPAPTGDIEGSKHRPESRREAIQGAINKAYERAANPEVKPERQARQPPAKPAEAKPGHNNPPKDEPEKIDLRKRPETQEQPRDRGRFVSRETVEQQVPEKPPTKAPELPRGAPYREPPLRMADHAKREWANTPESVRGEVHRIQKEFVQAYNYYKGAHEAFKPVERFHQMAQQHGTTLEKALSNYVSMEQRLRADPIAGLDIIVNNLGLKTPDGQPIGFRDIAYHVLSQTPEQVRMLQHDHSQEAAAKQIGALHQQVAHLQSTIQQMQYTQQHSYTRTQVDQFADTHPRFDELGTQIEQELKFGFDLETAYRRAELLSPTTHAAQTRTQSAQTRTPDRSIHGSPEAVVSTARRERPRGAAVPSTRDAVTNAIRRVNGGF